MKDMDALDEMTLWDINANEGVLTHFVLGITFLTLSVAYALVGFYFWVRFLLRR